MNDETTKTNTMTGAAKMCSKIIKTDMTWTSIHLVHGYVSNMTLIKYRQNLIACSGKKSVVKHDQHTCLSDMKTALSPW